MRLLFHFYDLHQRAGIQRAITELSNALAAKGHEVVLAVNTRRTDAVYPIDERVIFEDISNPEPTKFGVRGWPLRSMWALREVGMLRSLIKRHQPSIVVDHGTALGLLYPRRSLAGVPFVLQRHFPVRRFPNGKLLHRFLSLVSGSKTIVALTRSIADELHSQGHRKTVVIPNVLPSEASPVPYCRAVPNTGVLIGRGRTPQKGFDIFLHALARMKTSSWRFVIVGPGVESDPLLLSLVRSYGLENRVELLPATDNPVELMARCSCIVMPSRYEGLPMVALEGLGIGRPVIASDIDGLRDLVKTGLNGIVIPPEDPDRLAHVLDFVAQNPTCLGYFAANAVESVNCFSGETIVREWEGLATQLAKA